MPESQWGALCERLIERGNGTRGPCGDPKIIHRGPNHTGPCASLMCAVDLVNGWSTTSRCAGYVGPDPDGPPIPDAPGETPSTPSAEVPW